MNPPLRSQADADLLIEGIADGTITILCSDHAPHCDYEKEVEFDQAPFGIVGLETELGLFLDLLVHRKKAIDLPRLIAMYTTAPAELLGLERGTLSPGAAGDVTILDPGPGMDGGYGRIPVPLAELAFSRLGVERPGRADHRGGPQRLGAGPGRVTDRRVAGEGCFR